MINRPVSSADPPLLLIVSVRFIRSLGPHEAQAWIVLQVWHQLGDRRGRRGVSRATFAMKSMSNQSLIAANETIAATSCSEGRGRLEPGRQATHRAPDAKRFAACGNSAPAGRAARVSSSPPSTPRTPRRLGGLGVLGGPKRPGEPPPSLLGEEKGARPRREFSSPLGGGGSARSAETEGDFGSSRARCAVAWGWSRGPPQSLRDAPPEGSIFGGGLGARRFARRGS